MSTSGKEYKSPLRKLVAFFEKSRDGWKAKCLEFKYETKKLKQRVGYLTARNRELKQKVRGLERQLAQLREHRKVEETIKKKSCTEERLGTCSRLLDVKVAYHRYTLGQIELYVYFILHASVSLRGSSRVLEIIWNFFGLDVSAPCWSCGRLWVLRPGYFKLTREKERARDWVWIIDHTVQVGSEKCLVILGIRLSSLPPAGKRLSYEDVEPIAVIPTKESNGPIVAEQLEETIALTGVPRQIIADHGSDLAAGMRKFCEKHPQTCTIYDIKHKTASLLKQELKDEERWKSFCEQCAQTASRVRQTDLAFLMPPNQRTKGRYMNIDVLIGWAMKALSFVDADGGKDHKIDVAQIEAKLGWIREYRKDLADWEALWILVSETESFVRNQGLYRGQGGTSSTDSTSLLQRSKPRGFAGS